MFKDLIQKCSSLKTLVFAGKDLSYLGDTPHGVRVKPPFYQNFSVKTLVLPQDDVRVRIPYQISWLFPSLRKVLMIVKTNQNTGRNCSAQHSHDSSRLCNLEKNVPVLKDHSRLDCVHLRYEMELEVHKNYLMFFRVQTNNKIQFFYCLENLTTSHKTLFNQCTRKQHEGFLRDLSYRDVAFCSFECSSLKTLVIESDSHRRSHTFLKICQLHNNNL